MTCARCGGETSVIDSRPVEVDPSVNRRRRQCEGCGRRFYTWESTLNPIRYRASARARREQWRAKQPPEVKPRSAGRETFDTRPSVTPPRPSSRLRE